MTSLHTFAWATLPSHGSTRRVHADKPNILIIWGDDIGLSNLSCYSGVPPETVVGTLIEYDYDDRGHGPALTRTNRLYGAVNDGRPR